MSVKLMSRVWDSNLKSGVKFVLGMLCDAANDDGLCYPSQERLAAKCSMTTRAISNHIETLEKMGLITRSRRQKGGRRTSDIYQIHIENIGVLPEKNSGMTPYSVPEKFSGEKNSGEKLSPEKKDRAYRKNFPKLPEKSSGSFKEEPSVREPSIEPSVYCEGGADAPPVAPKKSSSRSKSETNPASNPDNVAAWQAYARAYRQRYGVLPASNAKVRGQVAQFVRSVGADIAPDVAAYYVSHNDSFFVRRRHEIGLLLANYQQVLTDYQRGEQMTATKARQTEKTQANAESHKGALEILKDWGVTA